MRPGVKGWSLGGNAKSIVSIGPPSPHLLCWTARVLALEGIRPVEDESVAPQSDVGAGSVWDDAGCREDRPVNPSFCLGVRIARLFACVRFRQSSLEDKSFTGVGSVVILFTNTHGFRSPHS